MAQINLHEDDFDYERERKGEGKAGDEIHQDIDDQSQGVEGSEWAYRVRETRTFSLCHNISVHMSYNGPNSHGITEYIAGLLGESPELLTVLNEMKARDGSFARDLRTTNPSYDAQNSYETAQNIAGLLREYPELLLSVLNEMRSRDGSFARDSRMRNLCEIYEHCLKENCDPKSQQGSDAYISIETAPQRTSHANAASDDEQSVYPVEHADLDHLPALSRANTSIEAPAQQNSFENVEFCEAKHYNEQSVSSVDHAVFDHSASSSYAYTSGETPLQESLQGNEEFSHSIRTNPSLSHAFGCAAPEIPQNVQSSSAGPESGTTSHVYKCKGGRRRRQSERFRGMESEYREEKEKEGWVEEEREREARDEDKTRRNREGRVKKGNEYSEPVEYLSPSSTNLFYAPGFAPSELVDNVQGTGVDARNEELHVYKGKESKRRQSERLRETKTEIREEKGEEGCVGEEGWVGKKEKRDARDMEKTRRNRERRAKKGKDNGGVGEVEDRLHHSVTTHNEQSVPPVEHETFDQLPSRHKKIPNSENQGESENWDNYYPPVKCGYWDENGDQYDGQDKSGEQDEDVQFKYVEEEIYGASHPITTYSEYSESYTKGAPLDHLSSRLDQSTSRGPTFPTKVSYVEEQDEDENWENYNGKNTIGDQNEDVDLNCFEEELYEANDSKNERSDSYTQGAPLSYLPSRVKQNTTPGPILEPELSNAENPGENRYDGKEKSKQESKDVHLGYFEESASRGNDNLQLPLDNGSEHDWQETHNNGLEQEVYLGSNSPDHRAEQYTQPASYYTQPSSSPEWPPTDAMAAPMSEKYQAHTRPNSNDHAQSSKAGCTAAPLQTCTFSSGIYEADGIVSIDQIDQSNIGPTYSASDYLQSPNVHKVPIPARDYMQASKPSNHPRTGRIQLSTAGQEEMPSKPISSGQIKPQRGGKHRKELTPTSANKRSTSSASLRSQNRTIESELTSNIKHSVKSIVSSSKEMKTRKTREAKIDIPSQDLEATPSSTRRTSKLSGFNMSSDVGLSSRTPKSLLKTSQTSSQQAAEKHQSLKSKFKSSVRKSSKGTQPPSSSRREKEPATRSDSLEPRRRTTKGTTSTSKAPPTSYDEGKTALPATYTTSYRGHVAPTYPDEIHVNNDNNSSAPGYPQVDTSTFVSTPNIDTSYAPKDAYQRKYYKQSASNHQATTTAYHKETGDTYQKPATYPNLDETMPLRQEQASDPDLYSYRFRGGDTTYTGGDTNQQASYQQSTSVHMASTYSEENVPKSETYQTTYRYLKPKMESLRRKKASDFSESVGGGGEGIGGGRGGGGRGDGGGGGGGGGDSSDSDSEENSDDEHSEPEEDGIGSNDRRKDCGDDSEPVDRHEERHDVRDHACPQDSQQETSESSDEELSVSEQELAGYGGGEKGGGVGSTGDDSSDTERSSGEEAFSGSSDSESTTGGGGGYGGGRSGGGGGSSDDDSSAFERSSSEDEFSSDSDPEDDDIAIEAAKRRQEQDIALSRPEKRIQRLEKLERKVVNRKRIRRHTDWDTELSVSNAIQILKEDLRVVTGALSNWHTLQQGKFCGNTINALVVEGTRVEGTQSNTALLQPLNLVAVEQLRDGYLELVELSSPSNSREGENFLKQCCRLLGDMKLAWPEISNGVHDCSTENLIYASRAVSRFIDMAMISYSGAHFERFDITHLQTRIKRISIRCNVEGTSYIVMYQRRFKCLSGLFHNRSAWVFQSCDSTFTQVSLSPLYLSTTIEQFVDIWGPVWKTCHKSTPTIVMKYNVGIGYVVPWKRNKKDPPLVGQELFCHWTSKGSDLDRADGYFPETALGDSTRLLLGAPKFLRRNPRCQEHEKKSKRMKNFAHDMKNAGRYDDLDVCPPRFVIDTRTVQVGLSTPLPHVTPNVNVSQAYKLREGSSHRDQLIAAWTSEPEKRDIKHIKNIWAVEVSACTTCALRITLFDLLRSENMRRFLRGRRESSDGRKIIKGSDLKRYFNALDHSSVNHFIKRYNHSRNHKVFAQLIGRCFEALKHTGASNKLNLKAMWTPPDGNAPCIIKYKHADHRWTGLLTNSHKTCAMVIVTEDCLEVRDGQPACLETKKAYSERYSVLETAIVTNPKVPRQDGQRYSLGYQTGRLRVFKAIGRRKLIVAWSKDRWGKMARYFHKRRNLHHRELLTWDDRHQHVKAVLVASHRTRK